MAAAQLFSGVGNPNGVVFASPGDIYQDETGAFYSKTSGTNTNTGWVAVSTSSVFVAGAGAGSAIQNNGSGNATTGVNSTVCGDNNQLSGPAAFAEGNQNVETIIATTAGNGGTNHLEGWGNTINVATSDDGGFNHVEGFQNALTATGGADCQNNHVEGDLHVLNALAGPGNGISFNHIEGNRHVLTTSVGTGACSFNHVEGDGIHITVNPGGDIEFSHFEGVGHVVTSTSWDVDDSHIEGFRNTVTDVDTGHVEGNENTVSTSGGSVNHVEGNQNNVTGNLSFAHVEGNNNTLTSTGNTNHVEGSTNSVTGTGGTNHVEGLNNAVTGVGSSTNHVEGSHCSSTTTQAHAEGSRAVAIRQTQHVHASGRFAADGDAQTSEIIFRGSTPGAGANESVELKYGDAADQTFTLEDGKAYVVKIWATASITGGAQAAAFELATAFLAIQDAGVITVNPAAPIAVAQTAHIGGVGSASWNINVTIGAVPTRLSIIFATGATITAAVRVVAKVEFTEVAHA